MIREWLPSVTTTKSTPAQRHLQALGFYSNKYLHPYCGVTAKISHRLINRDNTRLKDSNCGQERKKSIILPHSKGDDCWFTSKCYRESPKKDFINSLFREEGLHCKVTESSCLMTWSIIAQQFQPAKVEQYHTQLKTAGGCDL